MLPDKTGLNPAAITGKQINVQKNSGIQQFVLLSHLFLKRIVSILLILVLTLQCFSRLGMIAYYRINKSYIATVLCINKDKPQMRCDGKCYLAKQIRQEAERERHIPGNLKEISETVLFCEAEISVGPAAAGRIERVYPFYLSSFTGAHGSSIFHPPPFTA